MLSIFDQRESEQQPDKKLNLNRLQTVLEPRRTGPDEHPRTVVVEEPPKVKLAPPAVTHFEPRPPAVPPEPQVKQAPLPAPKDDEIPAELNEFAEQFTRGFRRVLISTVKDIQGPMLDDRRRLETAVDLFTKTARDMESMQGEVASARQKIDTLVRAVQDLSQRLGKVEDSGIIATTAAHANQDALQALEKRLDMQAGVLRTLHNGAQGREERMAKLLSTFQALQSMDTNGTPSSALPENL